MPNPNDEDREVTEQEAKEDEEQEVRDEDADTSDVDGEAKQDTAELERKLNAVSEAVANLTKMITTLVQSGAHSQADSAPEGIAEDGKPVKTEFDELEI